MAFASRANPAQKGQLTAGEKLDYIKSVVPELGGFPGKVKLSTEHQMYIAWYSLQDHSISFNARSIDTLYALCLADQVHATAGLRVIASHEIGHAESYVNPRFMAAMATVAAESFHNPELSARIGMLAGKVKSFYELFHSMPEEGLRRDLVRSFNAITGTIDGMDRTLPEAAAVLYAIAKNGFEPFIDSIAIMSIALPAMAAANLRTDGGYCREGEVANHFLSDISFERWKDEELISMAALLYPEISEGIGKVANFNSKEVVYLVGERREAIKRALLEKELQ